MAEGRPDTTHADADSVVAGTSASTAAPPKPPAAVLGLALLVSAVGALLGFVGLYVAVVAVGVLLPNLLLMSVVAVVSGVLGILTGLGRFNAGPAIALLCVAGAIGAGAAMGYTEASPNLTNLPFWRDAMKLWVVASIGVAGMLSLLAAIIVWSRRPGASLRRIGWAAATGVPLAGIVAGAIVLLNGASDVTLVIVTVGGGLIAVVLTAATGHQLIRSFEVADEPSDATPAAS